MLRPSLLMDKPNIIAIGVKPEDSSDASDGVSVPAPKGWSWPNGVDPKEGDRFMCMIKQGDDPNMLEIMDIDGLPLGDSEDDSQESDEPSDAPTSAMDMFAKSKASMMGK